MEEQIEKIIRDQLNRSEEDILLGDNPIEVMTLEIDKLTKDHYMKFVEWMLTGNDGTYMSGYKDKKGLKFITEIDEPYATLEDVYTYWKEKVTR